MSYDCIYENAFTGFFILRALKIVINLNLSAFFLNKTFNIKIFYGKNLF